MTGPGYVVAAPTVPEIVPDGATPRRSDLGDGGNASSSQLFHYRTPHPLTRMIYAAGDAALHLGKRVSEKMIQVSVL